MSKTAQIQQYVNNNPNLCIKTKDMAENCSVSLPTLLKYIKNNPEQFEKVEHGKYKILSTTVQSSPDLPQGTTVQTVSNNFLTLSVQSEDSDPFSW